MIFIRYTEDKNLEPLTLLPLLREWKVSGKGNLIEELNKIFRKFDKWYDSRLFEKHFSEDLESYGPLEDIVEGLYHSKKSGHPYDFSVISSDVLGAVYEQYLGYLQKKEGGKEENGRKSKRKQQGIYYTPTFVVDYIVKNTLGKILQEKSSEEIKNIRVLDPACGSGSFLIKACQTLIDYWQNQKREIKGSSKLDEIAKIMEKKAGQKILPTPAKLRILRENIFGVDLDPKAEEIAQLNLLLNAVSRRTLLPNLSHNITCGNSLISGTPKELKNYFGENWKDKKPFNWEEEFPEIFKDGGFDVVIGNPPYIMVENLPSNERRYLMSKYETAAKRFDIYITFIEKGLDLLKPGGFLSFIIPYPFLNQNYAEKLRKKILQDFNLIHILDLSEVKIFGDAIIRNCIIVIEKPRAGNDKKDKINVKKIYNEKDLSNLGNLPTRVFLKSIFKSLPKAMFRTDLNNLKMNLLEKIESKSISLGQICYVNWGARTGDIKKYVTKEKNNEYCKKMINARNVDRYIINYTNDYIIYKKEELYNPMFEELFESPKIVTRDISGKSRLKSALDTERYYTEHTVSLVVPFYYLKEVKRRGLKLTDEQINTSYNYDLKYILAIVNSALLNWYFISKLGGGLHVYPDDVKQFPIYKINFSNNEEKGKYDELVKLVDGILNLNKELQEIAKDSDKYHKIQQEIEKIDKEIDQKIYKLYGLVDEEIKIIEGK